jgi:anti-sigma factor RsiW
MMHPEQTSIVPYLRGELGESERRTLDAHLADCVECRRDLDDFRLMLDDLAHAAPKAPEPHWGAYRVEMREKLDRRLGRGRTSRRWWPISVALSGALVGVLVFFAAQDTRRETRIADLTPVEETVIGTRLDLLQQYALVERLDLLEDLELIRHLDQLEGVEKS